MVEVARAGVNLDEVKMETHHVLAILFSLSRGMDSDGFLNNLPSEYYNGTPEEIETFREAVKSAFEAVEDERYEPVGENREGLICGACLKREKCTPMDMDLIIEQFSAIRIRK